MFGILNIHKPSEWTSRDVVNRVQRLVRPAKAGHAGTLDPLATGVLVVCVGPATRLISYVQQQQKTYEATFLLGRSSSSDDIESAVTELADAPQPILPEIEAVLPQFLGSIQQRPPAFSALKVKGQRAYELARQGKQVELAPRTVEIYDLRVTGYAYPELRLSMQCGSGTYVRSVGRDLAGALGTKAVMSALTRTAIGEFKLTDALDIEQIDKEAIERNLRPPLDAVRHLQQLQLCEAHIREIQNGRLVAINELDQLPIDAPEVVAGINDQSQLVALLHEKRSGMIGAMCNFPQAE